MERENKNTDCKTYFRNVLQESFKDMKILNIDGSEAGNKGDNFMSSVFRYNISFLDSNNNVEDKQLLVKKLPSNAAWREAFGIDLAFRNEATAYNVVIPSIKKFRGEDDLGIPICYHASQNYIILEDLKPAGYKTVDRRLGMDLPHAKLALKELGRFHGSSLAMKHSQPNAFNGLVSKIEEIVFKPEKKETLGAAIVGSINKAVLGLKIFHASGNESLGTSINKLQSLKNSAFENLMNLVTSTGPLSVIAHGDFYLNNIMFKYDENDEVSDIMIIDLQAFRVASLSLDLLYFLTTSLRPGVMSSHFKELMESYHSSLNKEMNKLAPSAPKVTIEEILAELKSHSDYGLFMGFLVLPAVTAIKGISVDMDMESIFSAEKSFERSIDMLSPEYFRRIKQIVKDFEELGYL